ncbi:MAG: 2Fe-2S iron-sulfur cluster-binding protein [Rhizomicrobium sp.]
MSGFRLGHGGAHIDRARPLSFSFDGKTYRGFAGDTLTSALMANGIAIVGRSFKYHRPRGIIGTGFSETNALLRIGEGARATPNIPATRVLLTEGLVAHSQNAWPSVNFDLGRINDRLRPLFAAGFYYKTFMWPGWRLFEPFIRRAAGNGRAPKLPDPDIYDTRERHCGVLVVGAGPAGLMAALTAARTGADVVVLEADAHLGASLAAGTDRIDGMQASQWAADAETELSARNNAQILRRTTALGYYDHNFFIAVEEIEHPGLRQRLWKLRARQVVLACGAFERPVLFANNDLPGIMLAGAMEEYIARHAAAAGRAPLFVTTNDSGYRAAIAARQAGLAVQGIVDPRPESPLAEKARGLAIPVYCDSVVERAEGNACVCAAQIAHGGGHKTIACDVIAMSGGWSPAVQLFTQSGGTLRFAEHIGTFVPNKSAQAERSCGAAAGAFDLAEVLAGAASAGEHAAKDCGFAAKPQRMPAVETTSVTPSFSRVDPQGDPKTAFVDFQTDVTVADMALAVRENYRAPEHVKRYTVWGMGSDQGKLSAVNGANLLARMQGAEPGALGTTKFRPPFAPVAFSTLAASRGPLFRGWKRLPAHDWHVRRGAVFEDFGYFRPSHYPQGGETMEAAAAREALAVRSGVGIMESSSFGKIELKGPDAATFLDRVCAFRHSRLAVGTAGYNMMLNEFGTIIDDGVVSRLADDHFLITASSAHAERIVRWLEDWLQNEWPLDLVLRDVTTRWAVLTLAGPKAREVLAASGCNIALAAAHFPHHAVRTGEIAGVTVRIQRVSFTGELSYEINVAPAYAEAMADLLWNAGQVFGLVPFGLDALEILRIEKGYIHPGSDTDSRTLPADAGWTSPARRDDDFLGRQSLRHESATAPGRHHVVGFRPLDAKAAIPVGAHVIGGKPHPSQGLVTSSCFSPTLNAALALGLLDEGQSRHGEIVTLWSEGRSWKATVTSPRFFDPRGDRLHV